MSEKRKNWLDLLYFEETNIDMEAALEADRAKLEALGMMEDIQKLNPEQLKADIMRKSIAIMEAKKEAK